MKRLAILLTFACCAAAAQPEPPDMPEDFDEPNERRYFAEPMRNASESDFALPPENGFNGDMIPEEPENGEAETNGTEVFEEPENGAQNDSEAKAPSDAEKPDKKEKDDKNDAPPETPNTSNFAEESESIKKLFERNPFGKAPIRTNAQPKTDASKIDNGIKGLELSGIYCVNGKWFFSVADTVAKKSYTIELGGKIDEKTPYSIDFFDDETNTVSISNSLGTYALTLKKRTALAPAPKVQPQPQQQVQRPQAEGAQNTQRQRQNRRPAATVEVAE